MGMAVVDGGHISGPAVGRLLHRAAELGPLVAWLDEGGLSRAGPWCSRFDTGTAASIRCRVWKESEICCKNFLRAYNGTDKHINYPSNKCHDGLQIFEKVSLSGL